MKFQVIDAPYPQGLPFFLLIDVQLFVARDLFIPVAMTQFPDPETRDYAKSRGKIHITYPLSPEACTWAIKVRKVNASNTLHVGDDLGFSPEWPTTSSK